MTCAGVMGECPLRVGSSRCSRRGDTGGNAQPDAACNRLQSPSAGHTARTRQHPCYWSGLTRRREGRDRAAAAAMALRRRLHGRLKAARRRRRNPACLKHLAPAQLIKAQAPRELQKVVLADSLCSPSLP